MTRILVVEDDPVIQELVKSILESRNWAVDVANDGFASIVLLREHAYDAVLVDYHLPEMDGYALARLMRDIGRGRDEWLHLIAMTADRNGLTARRGADRLFDDILAKPFTPQNLIGLIERGAGQNVPSHGAAWAASALLADPGKDAARRYSETVWQSCGLSRRPKARIISTPTPDQVNAIELCFDIVNDATADIVLIVDALGFHNLLRMDSAASSHVPVVTLNREWSIISDSHFSISDIASWSKVAELLKHVGDNPMEASSIAARTAS